MKKQHRREFIKKSTIVAAGVPFVGPGISANYSLGKGKLVCQDIAEHFKQTGNWVNWEQTTDTFKAGNPKKPVKTVVVAWKASRAAIEEAIAMNADLFISHESICANASNASVKPEIEFALPTELPKFEKIEKAGLVVFRCHDYWDGFPRFGIRDAWQKGLDIGNNIIADEYPYYVTKIKPMTVGNLAKHILEKIKPLKQAAVMISGDREKLVSKIGTGTGVNTKPVALRNLGADVGIMTDDYYRHVREGVHANELGFPTIIVNHAVAEEWGIVNLAKYVQRQFPSLKVHHIPQFCPYEFITA